MSTKAFGYIRVSGKGQIQGDGFPRQEAEIRAYAAAHDIHLTRWFKEHGISGTTELDDRPALLEMLEALAANGIKLVLIEKLDRLARDLMVQETIISDLRKRGFELVSATEPDLLQNDPARTLMRQIFGAIAQYEKAMIVAKLRGSRERARLRKGRCEGRKPYGTSEDERRIIIRMQELRQEGLGFDRIAAALDQEGHKPRSGKQWHGLVVNRIMKANSST